MKRRVGRGNRALNSGLLAILLLAFFLRVYRLDAQSFWNDEGNSARIAERTPDLILEGAGGDVHPPGYYLLLHYWRALAGQSEFALRFVSVVAGMLVVVLTHSLGRRLFSEAVGVMGAFLGAISPFATYYSQEARMYALLAAISAASTYAAIRILTGTRCSTSGSDLDGAPMSLQRRHSDGAPSFLQRRHSDGAPSFLQRRHSDGAPSFLQRRHSDGAAYILVSAAGLYIQYAFPFVLLVHNAVFGLWWLAVARRWACRWRWIARWVGLQAAILALYLPWLPIALRSVIGRQAAGRAYELGHALVDVLRILSVGTTLPLEETTATLIGTALLLLAGLWPGRPHPPVMGTRSSPKNLVSGLRRHPLCWLEVSSIALYLLLPIGLIFALDLYKPAWLKFLVVVLPPFHILLAHGASNLAQAVQPAAARIASAVPFVLSVLAAVATYPSLHNLYFDPTYARDDYRQIAADVIALKRPNDAIILNAPNQWEVFTYYFGHTTNGPPASDIYPAPYHPDDAGAEAFLSPVTGRYRRLFVLYWGDAESDPQRLIGGWLATHAYKATDRWYGRVRLATYGVAALPEAPAGALNVRFGESICLRDYALPGDSFAPRDILPVTLFWEASAPVSERYKVTLQLLDDSGKLVAQHDAEPGGSLVPTNTWQPGQRLADRYGLTLPPDLSPGRYTLILGLYHVSSGERLLTATGGDHVVLRDVEVRASTP